MAEWTPLTQAAEYVGISPAKLSKMVKQKRIASKKDPRDERLTLVDLQELRRVFNMGGTQA